jgi:hypothetical protein
MLSKQSLTWAAAALLCTTLAGGAASLYYYSRYTQLEAEYRETLDELELLTIKVNIMIDYGNGTAVWHNATRVGLTETLLNATLQVADVQYTVTEFGAFVDAIDGVSGVESHYWIWYRLDGGWQMGPVGSDQYRLHDGDVVAWIYTGF